MAVKNLVIGIGTTGLNIIEQAQQNHYEFIGTNKPATGTRYLFIETDTKTLPRKTASGETDIEKIYFPLSNVDVDMKNLKKKEGVDTSWFPEVKDVIKADIGAGGMPAYGRLGFWSNQNYNDLRKSIVRLYEEMGGDNNTQVLIVGTLTGGTGSGVCVDVAYLVRNTLHQNPNVNAIFLLPNTESYNTNINFHVNAFSATSAIQHYTNSNNDYTVTYPDGQVYTPPPGTTPYMVCQYVSQDYVTGKASMTDLDELIKMAGVLTMLHFIGTDGVSQNLFHSTVQKRRVDASSNETSGKLITSGFYMIQYPKAQMKELLSIDVVSDMFKRLVDKKNYINHANIVTSITSSQVGFQVAAKAKFENILSSIFEMLDGTGAGESDSLMTDFDVKIDDIIKKRIDGGEDRFIFQQFSSNSKGNYFEMITNQSKTIADALIDQLSDFITDVTQNYKNLHVAHIFIKTITDHIDDLLSFYEERYGVVSGMTGDQWNAVLGNEIERLYGDQLFHTVTLQKSTSLKFLFKELSFLLKTHVLIPELLSLKKKLKSREEKKSIINKKVLPNEFMFTNAFDSLNMLISGEGEDSKMTLRRRSAELINQLTEFTNCFKMVYASGNREDDMKAAKSDYLQGTLLDFDALLNSSIWSFCQNTQDDIYNHVIKSSMSFMNNQEFFQTHNLSSILEGLTEDNQENVNLKNKLHGTKEELKQIAVPAMLQLDHSEFKFGDDAYAPLLVVTNDFKQYKSLFTKYPLGSNNIVDIPGLEDVIILYQEYGNIQGDENKLDIPHHLFHADNIKKYITKELEKSGDKFFKKKFPYLKKKDLKLN